MPAAQHAASQHTIAGTVLTMPVRVRKADVHTAMFSVPADATQRLIDYSGLKVCEFRPGRAVVTLMLARYMDGDLCRYNEFGTCIMVNPPGSTAGGLKALGELKPYIDLKRVGIYGTSYGGYFSVMAILRHPELFRAACASSSVTAWQHYDTIYTERYMGLPWDNENKAGYDAGSAMTYAGDLKGHLMLYFGSADNNVHPSNTYMLVDALEKKGKRYDLQVGPDRGHTQMNSVRMWEYFIKWLILDPNAKPQKAAWNGRAAASHARVA
jgi:pimeloyl-ACP methyl ester carboxylesterase